MIDTGSYDAANLVQGIDSELDRLRAQARVSWDREARTLAYLGLRDGMSVLELGCGPGFITEQLLELLPRSPITALDSDPKMIQRAELALVGRASDRLKLLEASAMDSNLPDAAFDFAIARYLVQHLSDPAGAIRETLRVLRPGGKLAIIDIDGALWGIAEPTFPELAPIYAKTGVAQARQGGNRLIGRRLWRLLHAAGFRDLELEAFVYHSDSLGIEPFAAQLDPERLRPLVEEGVISTGEFDRIRQGHRKFLTSAEPYVLMVGLIGCGRKPE